MTREEVLQLFLKTFDSDDDAIVTPSEFLDYYAGVSASIDNDLYLCVWSRDFFFFLIFFKNFDFFCFLLLAISHNLETKRSDLMMRSAWKL
jgi:hypothetical protein